MLKKRRSTGSFWKMPQQLFFQMPGNMIWIKYVLKPAYEYYRDPVNTYEGFAMVDPDRFIR